MISIQQLLNLKGSTIWSISPKATVYQGLELLAKHNIGALPVVEDGQLVGMFSERDYARKIILKGKTSYGTLIEGLMTSKVFYLRPNRSLEDAMRMMTEKHIRHLPVLDKGNLVGMITIGDVVKYMIQHQKSVIQDLEGYIAGSYVG